MASESANPDDCMDRDVAALPQRPSPPSHVSAWSVQETGGGTDVGHSTAASQDAPRDGMTVPEVGALNVDGPPIPVWQAVDTVDHGRETDRPQLHDGPPGPSCFPLEFDDSLAKGAGNGLERSRSVHARDNASALPVANTVALGPSMLEGVGKATSTIHALNVDEPSIPSLHVADHEEETEGPQLQAGPPGPPPYANDFDDSLAKRVDNDTDEPQLHDGPPGPPCFPLDFDDSLAKRIENELERNLSDCARDDASTVQSATGASVASAAAEVNPLMVEGAEGGSVSIRGTAPPTGPLTETAVSIAEAGLNQPPTGSSTFIAEAYMVEGGTVYEAELDEPQADESQPLKATLPFYQRKGCASAITAAALLAIGVAVATAVLLSNNIDGNTINKAETSSVVIDPPTPAPTMTDIRTTKPTAKVPSRNPTKFPTFHPTSSSPTFTLSPSPSFQPSSSVSPSCGSLMMMIQIQYDSYPAETSYELEEIASEGGQEIELASHSGSAGDNNHEESICLDDGLYSFSFYDSFGDGFNGIYSLTLVPGETIIMQDNSVSPYGEQVLFRLPYDGATLDVRWIGSGGQLLPSLSPSSSLPPSSSPTITLSPSSSSKPSSSVSPSCGSLMMMIQIQYDSYPEETSYELEKIASEDGQEIELASHSGSAGDNNHEESICLDDGLYSFSFYDSFGDGFNGVYSLTLVPGETIIMQDNSVSPYGEQVLFRLPYDGATLDVRWIGSDGQLLPTLSPSSSLPPSSSPTITLSPSSSSKPSSSVSPSCGSLIMIQIQYDFYPWETSYELEKIASEDGQEIELASHSGFTGDNNHEESICLDDGLYSFSFYDSFGDGFNGVYSLTLVPGETIIMQDNSVSPYGEQVLFRLPYDGATLDVRTIGSGGQLLTLAPTNNPTASNKPTTSNIPTKILTLRPTGRPTLRPTNYPTTSNYRAKLLAPDGAAGDYFGGSVAIYGDSIVVGVQYDDDNGSYSGSAHVFVRSGEVWTHQAKLLAPEGAEDDFFGKRVAIYGDTIVVGAHWDDDNGYNSGSAHVFVRSGEEWTHQAKLLAPDGAAGDYFGGSVAIYGDSIVVGVQYDDDNGSYSGSAHVFVRSGEEWTHQAKLLAPDGAAGDYFGGSVAIYGDSIVVGAQYDGENGSGSGSAHVFVRSGEEWSHKAKLLAPEGAALDRFGFDVAIYGDSIVVGALRDDNNGSGSGSAHVFVRSGEEWTHQAKLLAPDGTADDRFGRSVAIYGDTIVVGANGNDNRSYSGSAHVFVRSGKEWTHQAKLLAPDGSAYDNFGVSVEIYGDSIVAGARGDSDNGYDSGSAHVFAV